ncbi:alanyl-tRNA editing protein [Clostridium estertheticum]|uniref:alanyl-tRNA editing protein n=1 Tax=Clostridium estertheticum TaxID=238834 RepID=UPI001CF1D2C7|nr:DHHA1 domain-containing protein [Clostridium estertheticum]MCB2352555.1 DHHA1 domain-containing protein [Clostridium estertheticum]WAG39870.1 DHHA1 domain-containing protein [Clostridium estertheticum]
MEKLYYEDQYKAEFTAEIINIIKKENKYHVELNRTYFYPKDDNQPSDTGHINESLVISVYEENNKIYHVLEVKPLKIHKVKCNINFDLRYDYMQQHLGQHILSACISNLFNLPTIGFKLGLTSSTIDLDKGMGLAEIRDCEKKANDIVNKNIKIETLNLANSELKKLSLKKFPVKPGEKVRVVKIADIDIFPSQGIYPNSTIEVQLIKIIKFEKYKTGVRIEFICGERAVSDYILKFEAIEKMSKLLSCNNDTVISKVETLTGELNKSLTTSRVLSATVATYEVQNMLKEAEKIADVRILKFIYDKMDLKYATMLATKLVTSTKVIVLFGVKLQDKANLLFMCSKDLKIIRMDSLLKDAITLIDGKGGGSEFSAQGGGKNNNNLDSALDYALSKIKESILHSHY